MESDLELLEKVYRQPCLKYQNHEECSKCPSGSVGKCEIDFAYQTLQKNIKIQDQVIKECIKLLSVDGANTKGKVKELLKELVK